MLERLRTHRGLVAFVATYYVAFLTAGVLTGGSQVLYYAVLMPTLFLVVAIWDARRHFSRFVLWGLGLWGALHMAGGLIPVPGDRVLYNLELVPFLRFDLLVHVIGFGFAGLAFWESVRQATDRVPGPAVALMAGLGFGGLNEMVEFLITRLVPDTNIGGFENTGWDLVANALGATLAALWVQWSTARNSEARPQLS